MKNHIAPVIQNVIEKDPFKGTHVLRCEVQGEAVRVLERGGIFAVVEIEDVGVNDHVSITHKSKCSFIQFGVRHAWIEKKKAFL
ncbi:hypothetical protein D3C76_1660270 [compost metagenome]